MQSSFRLLKANTRLESTKTKSRINAPPYARSSKPNKQARTPPPMQEVSNHIRSMSWPKQRSRKARNSDALLASARITKKEVTGRSRRRRPVRSKIAKQKSQEGRKKRMNIRTKELLAVPICCTPASRQDWRVGSHQYTVNQDCMATNLRLHIISPPLPSGPVRYLFY